MEQNNPERIESAAVVPVAESGFPRVDRSNISAHDIAVEGVGSYIPRFGSLVAAQVVAYSMPLIGTGPEPRFPKNH